MLGAAHALQWFVCRGEDAAITGDATVRPREGGREDMGECGWEGGEGGE